MRPAQANREVLAHTVEMVLKGDGFDQIELLLVPSSDFELEEFASSSTGATAATGGSETPFWLGEQDISALTPFRELTQTLAGRPLSFGDLLQSRAPTPPWAGPFQDSCIQQQADLAVSGSTAAAAAAGQPLDTRDAWPSQGAAGFWPGTTEWPRAAFGVELEQSDCGGFLLPGMATYPVPEEPSPCLFAEGGFSCGGVDLSGFSDSNEAASCAFPPLGMPAQDVLATRTSSNFSEQSCFEFTQAPMAWALPAHWCAACKEEQASPSLAFNNIPEGDVLPAAPETRTRKRGADACGAQCVPGCALAPGLSEDRNREIQRKYLQRKRVRCAAACTCLSVCRWHPASHLTLPSAHARPSQSSM